MDVFAHQKKIAGPSRRRPFRASRACVGEDGHRTVLYCPERAVVARVAAAAELRDAGRVSRVLRFLVEEQVTNSDLLVVLVVGAAETWVVVRGCRCRLCRGNAAETAASENC